MEQFEFRNPLFLILLAPYFLGLFWYIFKRYFNRDAAIAVSSERLVRQRASFRALTYRFLPVFRFLSLLFLILALSRPGTGLHYSSIKNMGIDIMIALDASKSMQGEDFTPKNRLTVAKQVIKDFVSKRQGDRIGLVVFAGDAFLNCPLTVEHEMLNDIVDEIDFNSVQVDGTAIGDSIALSASRMVDRESKSKIILLLTDGMNNRGIVDPETAAQTCVEKGIKIYSVGIGREGKVVYPSGNFLMGKRMVMNHFDEESIKKLSDMTGGTFYRAQSSGVLWENIDEIDRLEKSEVELKVYHEFTDKFEVYLLFAVSFFFMEIFLRSVVYRKVP